MQINSKHQHENGLCICAVSGGSLFTKAVDIYEKTEGDGITVQCLFDTYGSWKYLCRNDCEKQENILVQTSSNKGDNGRYSLEMKKQRSYPYVMNVSIRNVTLSDAGTYRCGSRTLEENWTYAHEDFIIKVSSGLSPETPRKPHEDHTPRSEVALYVGLSLSALLILSVTLTSLILYRRKRARTTPGAPDIPVYAQIQESSCMYEDVRADRAEGLL
ncbi:uncharacterized protein LOC110160236 isoform X2 [Boleophthalmus pectinirostris]|uniref:uncharacterized protein LOC110160236 isoform X2 n=1 Tax=Boleophthalmus pectinirostris TaxID=150288 RepID=UPI00242FE64F|nr:uncharacterized protein LOC110160236 isoform X2 [Boleophthalmus pectinirostris]